MNIRLFSIRTLFPMLIAALIMTSCKKDSSTQDDIIGNWTTDNATFSTMIGTKTFQQYLVDEMGLTTEEAQAYITLFDLQMKQTFTGTINIKSDNTYTATLGGEADNGTWSLSSDRKKLTIDSATEDPVILDVIELTSSKIHLQEVETTTEDINEDGTAETVTVTVDLTFKR